MSFKCECMWAAKKMDRGVNQESELKASVRKERLAYDQGQLVLQITEDNGNQCYQRKEVVTDKRGVPVLRIIRSMKNAQLVETYSGPIEWVMEPFQVERFQLIRRTYKKSK